MPGVVKVVVKNNFVGVVAEKPWQAIQAAAKLKATWTAGRRTCRAHGDFHDYLRNQKPTRDTFVVNSKDVDEKLASAATVVKATYLLSVSDARVDRQLVRGCRRAGRQGDRSGRRRRRSIR